MPEQSIDGEPDIEKGDPSREKDGQITGSGEKRPASDPEASVQNSEAESDDEEQSTLPFSKARCIALVTTVTGASWLNTITQQATVIILPTIGRDIGIPESRQQWIVSSYSLAFGCFLLLWGRIADLYGKRPIFILGSAFVTVTLIANPFLPNEIAFNVFRGFQGLGAAANVPTAIGILGVTFPPGKAKNYAFSTYAAGAPLGAVFGNLIGGFVASRANWKWVFGVNAGFALAVTIAGFFLIPPPAPDTIAGRTKVSLARSVDWLGGFLITAGLIALLFALTDGNVVGWSTVWIYMLIVIAVLLVGAFVAWEWYQEKHTSRAPLMKVSIFKNRLFSAAMIIMGLFFAAFNNWLISATYFFQNYQGLSALQTTLRFIPTGVVGVITAFIMSRLIAKVPTYMVLMFGNFCMVIGCVLFAAPIPPHTSYFAYGLFSMILSVIAADTAWPCLTLFTSKSLPREDQALGGALINASGQIGRSIGLAISTAIETAVIAHKRGVPVSASVKVTPWDPASLAGLRASNWFSAAISVGVILIVGLAFRGTGIVGKIEKIRSAARSGGGEEGIMNEEDIQRR